MSKREADAGADDVANATLVATQTPNGRRSRRTMIFALVSTVFAIVCIAVALQVFVAERIPILGDAELERAIKLWNEHGPKSYDMDIELRGARPGNVHIEVRDGVVKATTRDGRVPPQHTWDTWTVPGMFDTLAEDLQIAADPETQIQAAPGTKWRLRCEFDSENGIPRRYQRFVSGGPEVFWQIVNFQHK